MNLFRCEKGCGIFPDFSVFGWNGELKEKREACLKDHAPDVLTPVEGSFISDKPDSEPVKTTYFYALDSAGKKWVVRKWRNSIDEPCQYEIFHGAIHVKLNNLRVREKDLTKQLFSDAAREKIPLTNNQTDLLVAHIGNHIKFYRYHREIKEEDILVNGHPLEISVRMDERLIRATSSFCRKIFPNGSDDFLDKFFRENRDWIVAGSRSFEIVRV